MGGSALPIVGGLVSGFMGQKGAEAQSDAMQAAAGQSAAAQMEAARLQKEYGEKSLLAQLYLAQQAMAMQQEQARMAMESEARALEAIEPYRRVGYSGLSDLYGLQQDALGNPLSVVAPPELTQMFGQEQSDLQRQLGRQMALQGLAGSPLASSTMADQMRRLSSDQTARGYTAGLQKAQLEDARKWGKSLDLAQMGAGMGTQGYGLAGSQMPNLASAYQGLGSGLGSTLGGIGSGMAGAQQGLAGMYSQMAPMQATAAASPWANWGNQIGSLTKAFMQQPSQASMSPFINTGFGVSSYMPATNQYTDPYYAAMGK